MNWSHTRHHDYSHRRWSPARHHADRVAFAPAFTLVEMLVATTLVVLIMMMFSQIYGTTIQTITLQRGIGNNDQKARSLNTIILNDLRARTYRQATSTYGAAKGIVPLAPGDEPLVDPDRQKGYFYFSENDPLNDTDDVLQFTAMIATAATVGDQSADSTKVYLGRAANLPNDPTDPDNLSSNQPDLDDKLGDHLGQSRAAEITYFMRSGNLYRRILLLRDPISGTATTDLQPEYENGTRIFGVPTAPTVRDYTNATTSLNNFYTVFDYSASRFFDDTSSGTSYLWFNSIDSLLNTNESADHKPIALPWNRFGFYNNPQSAGAIPNNVDHGCPREYEISTNANSRFIGRYTSEETSNLNMGWPGRFTESMNRSVSAPINPSTYTVNTFAGGARMAEDLLLTNVEAFNIEYYDDNSQQFTSLSTNSSGTTPLNSWSRNNNPTYGPLLYPASGRINNVFDTWHPQAFTVTSASTSTVTQPPVRPLIGTGTSYDTWNDIPVAPATVNVGDTVLIQSLQPLPPGSGRNSSIVYRAIRAGAKGPTEPSFPFTFDNIVTELPGDLNMNGDLTDDGVIWQCIDNRIGLKAIQITIRFRDPGKGLPKQVTLVHSFVE